MTTLQQWAESDAAPWTKSNENDDALSAAAIFAKNALTTTGLIWGFLGGLYNGNTIANGTVTLTDASDNYVVVLRSAGVVSTSTSSANSVNPLYAKLYKVTCAGGVVTAVVDQRWDANGLMLSGGSSSVAANVPATRYTIELANTTDSDPGAGLLKFNNATPASATFLYVDDSTSDGVDLSTYFLGLGASGYITIQSVADAGEWAIFKWTAITDGTSYFKFAVTAYASLGTLDDADAVLVAFDSDAAPVATTPVLIQIAVSDETTALTAGTAKVTFRAPYAFTLTDVRASVTTAPTGGTQLTVDVNKAGTTVLSTKLTFDAGEKTTTTAATPRVISDSAIADDVEFTIDIDAVGSTIAGAGLKVTLIGTKP